MPALDGLGAGAGGLGDVAPDMRGTSGRLFVLYGRLLAVLLGGYLLFDKAFAYLHVPGTPLFVSEIVLGVGTLAALAATRYLRVALRYEAIFALLLAFAAWGLIRALPGMAVYRMDALRDSVLWYYSLFAVLVAAALARSPQLLERLMAQLARLAPWLLLWLPLAVVLTPLAPDAPAVPFSAVSVLTHKSGNAAIAALLVLGQMWLFPETRSARSRAVWSVMALVVVALAATQNRGGLLGVVAGGTVGLVFLRNRVGLLARVLVISTVGLGLASMLSLRVPIAGLQGRDFSAEQLVANVVSLSGQDSPGNLGGTVEGRQELWSRILAKQVADGHLVDGSGFGQNLASEVGVYDEGKDTLRSPHNSHLHILARMGLVGISLWIALWLGWYWRLLAGCRRLARQGLYLRHRVGVLCLMVTTAILVSSFFDPQLEGPQVASLLWTAFGIGVTVTSVQPWFADPAPTAAGQENVLSAQRRRRREP